MDQVYVFEVEDADAAAWRSEIAVLATTAAEAHRRIRAAGLHKKQIHRDGRPARVLAVAELPGVVDSPSGFMRRRDDDGGWTAWEQVAAGTPLSWRVSGQATVRTRGSGHR
ncbi:hypothetical protein J4G33_11910 [Actinotalea sp. BY-33]|uniref:Uncharacterized protein n=1 Tax=Actinotalea soli TaxID=2819234 RepID=A0A939LWF2_9CELL|nr:hypothetical protein [Actinotalea soli]MBO1752507.1 hypothetical protein [Actinotalea soli]